MHKAFALLMFLAACGTSVKGSAHVVRGATTQTGPRVGGIAPATDGHYYLSPSAGTVTITHLGFKGPSDSDDVDLTGCAPSYERDTADLASILDCPFELGTGTYTSMSISVSGTAQVTVDDPTAGLYTDGTGLVTAAPSGGAAASPIKVPTSNGDGTSSIETAFQQPLVVKQGQPVTVTILEDMIHTVDADVSGGSASFDTALPLPPVSLLATAGDVTTGGVEYYSPVGTAADFRTPAGTTGNETGSARVFFQDGQPVFVWHVTLGNSEAWAADPHGGNGSRAGGYLGLDANGTLCWAQTQSDALLWPDSEYSMLCRMQHLTTVGDTTNIECEMTNTVPAPASGPTYATGCPQFTPTMSQMVTLVAK